MYVLQKLKILHIYMYVVVIMKILQNLITTT